MGKGGSLWTGVTLLSAERRGGMRGREERTGRWVDEEERERGDDERRGEIKTRGDIKRSMRCEAKGTYNRPHPCEEPQGGSAVWGQEVHVYRSVGCSADKTILKPHRLFDSVCVSQNDKLTPTRPPLVCLLLIIFILQNTPLPKYIFLLLKYTLCPTITMVRNTVVMYHWFIQKQVKSTVLWMHRRRHSDNHNKKLWNGKSTMHSHAAGKHSSCSKWCGCLEMS